MPLPVLHDKIILNTDADTSPNSPWASRTEVSCRQAWTLNCFWSTANHLQSELVYFSSKFCQAHSCITNACSKGSLKIVSVKTRAATVWLKLRFWITCYLILSNTQKFARQYIRSTEIQRWLTMMVTWGFIERSERRCCPCHTHTTACSIKWRHHEAKDLSMLHFSNGHFKTLTPLQGYF